MNKLIKFTTIDGKRLVFIPSADGVRYVKSLKAHFTSDKGQQLFLTPCIHKIAGQDLTAFEVVFDTSILHMELKQNLPLNEVLYRIYTSGQINYYMKTPYSDGKPVYQEVVK